MMSYYLNQNGLQVIFYDYITLLRLFSTKWIKHYKLSQQWITQCELHKVNLRHVF